VAVGLRYGRGELVYKRGGGRKVDWQGPSLGFDISANAVNAEYRRAIPTLPGVEGSLFFVGVFGVNYLQRDGISLAPVRFGVGWRQGIGVSYMHFTRNKRLNPL